MTNYITDSTPIAALTVGDIKELIKEIMPMKEEKNNTPSGNYVYGLRGIQQLFGVSHKTAQEYKDTFLRPAVMQNGRKIVVDADLALELFNGRRDK